MRYDKRQIFNNSREEFNDLLENRARNYFVQFETAELRHPTIQELSKLNTITEFWKKGDRLYKYAFKYYGDPELWWIIAWYNQRPTEAEFQFGDVVEIPMPLEQILLYFEI